MPPEPVPADPGWDDDAAWTRPDPMTSAELEAHLDWLCEHDDDPFDAPEEYWDPEASAPPPGRDELTAEELAEVRRAARDDLLAVKAATTGRRGPGQPGSARVFPGESASRAVPVARFAESVWDSVRAHFEVDSLSPIAQIGLRRRVDNDLEHIFDAFEALGAVASVHDLASGVFSEDLDEGVAIRSGSAVHR